ncbi:MAG: hypothetical protein ER33_05755 [Cyanobium sp. CACIAM 14]|nr:MAG: hypothetical protein ER33_05755 [Cyanobium sp. CACIAM 14]
MNCSRLAVQAASYEQDFYGWVEEQCAALRDRDSSRLDWSHLTEEPEALGRQEFRELVSRLGVLLAHLLKWEHQPERRCRSWFLTVREQRRAIASLLRRNPGLAARFNEAMEDGYDVGVDQALRETDLALRQLPAACPWSFEEALNPQGVCDTSGDWGSAFP